MIQQFLRKTCSNAIMCNVCHNYRTDVISSRREHICVRDITFCATDYLTPRDTQRVKNIRVLHHRENSARDSREKPRRVRLLIYRAVRINRPLEKCPLALAAGKRGVSGHVSAPQRSVTKNFIRRGHIVLCYTSGTTTVSINNFLSPRASKACR